MAPMPKILLFCRQRERLSALAEQLGSSFEVVASESVESSLQQLQTGNFSGVFLCGEETSPAGAIIHAGGLLDQLPDGFALLDTNERIVWCNASLRRLAGCDAGGEGLPFFDLFNNAQLQGPDFTPINTALATNQSTHGLMQVAGSRWLELQITPVFEKSSEIPLGLIAFVQDVTSKINERDRMKAIHQAGLELGDLSPEEVLKMGWEERKAQGHGCCSRIFIKMKIYFFWIISRNMVGRLWIFSRWSPGPVPRLLRDGRLLFFMLLRAPRIEGEFFGQERVNFTTMRFKSV